ncbi:hypothetical protein JCM11641_003280 [Rhodosporidiobolus odoratus]
MGLLALGTPLEWEQAKQHADTVRDHGIQQLLNIWDRLKDRTGDRLLWGDEIEYMVISYDHVAKNARLSLRQTEILQALQADRDAQRSLPPSPSSETAPPVAAQVNGTGEQAFAADVERPGANGLQQVREECIPVFHPEYGRYMLESTPGAPYGSGLEDLLGVEGNMRFRRTLARTRLKPHEVPLTLTSFPRLGAAGQFTDPYYEPGGQVARSLFLPDEVINPHVRFPTLTANIRRRRGEKVAINMPVFFDDKTPKPFIDSQLEEMKTRNKWEEDRNAREGAALPDHIYLDSMGFGMGCCCLQITFQACSVEEARRMYDSFVPVGPVMLALTAASPIFRGILADVDCRWDVIAGSVDDRTKEERGEVPLKNDRYRIPKSRYDSVDCYISSSPLNRKEYNDNDMPIDTAIRDKLNKGGMDDTLATHFAHLFIRDPIVVFEETLEQDDERSSDHFENIQSTNWQTVRFKPPPPGSPIGWRVEFRSMEVQLTDYENAAFAVFIVLLTRAVMTLGSNFYLPISKVDENMHRAHVRDALNTQKFYFRQDVFSPKTGVGCDPPMDLPPSSTSILPSAPPTPSVAHSREASGASTTSSDGRGCSSHQPSRAGSPLPDVSTEEFGPVEEEYEEFTLNEIFNGRPAPEGGVAFPGLVGVVDRYLDGLEAEGKVSRKVREGLERALELVRRRADGTLLSTASYIRQYISRHPLYKHDSLVSTELNYELIQHLDQIERGEVEAPELLPKGWREGYEAVEKEWRECCGAAAEAAREDGVVRGAEVIEDKGVTVGQIGPVSA